jgi:signal transduction histidine kinase
MNVGRRLIFRRALRLPGLLCVATPRPLRAASSDPGASSSRRIPVGPDDRGHASAKTPQRRALVGIVPMVAAAVLLALVGERLQLPRPSAFFWGCLTAAPMVLRVYWRARRQSMRAAASSTLLMVKNGELERALQASRARILEAVDVERRRIERDLHDGVQQRLVALRIHVALAAEQSDRADMRTTHERLGVEVQDAIDALRDLAHGVYPPILTDLGVGAALKAAARQSPTAVRIEDGWPERQPEAVETAVYFCCQECLQNVAKHAGRGASATVSLRKDARGVSFVVLDDGAGFDAAAVTRGIGLSNLADRVGAVGGTLTIDARPGKGTRIAGDIPGPRNAGERHRHEPIASDRGQVGATASVGPGATA